MDALVVRRPRFLVVGGGYAGMMAALRLASRDAGEVTLLDASDVLVERVRLHEALALGRDVTHPLAELVLGTGITLLRGKAVHLAARYASLEDGRTLPFDFAVVATGSQIARRLPGAAHAMPLEHAPMSTLRPALLALAQRGGRVVVLGGGLTGLEVATELGEALPGLGVTLVTDRITPALGEGAQRHVRAALDRLGVTLTLGRVETLHADAVAMEGGEKVAFDLALDCAGFAPCTLEGVRKVDATLRTEAFPNVAWAGDCARTDATETSPVHAGCKTAMPLGAHAADVVLALSRGEEPPVFRFRDTGYCVSLGRHDGVVQLAHADGRAMTFVGGRTAAWIKERIVRYTVASLRWQRSGHDYRWMRIPVRAQRPDGTERVTS